MEWYNKVTMVTRGRMRQPITRSNKKKPTPQAVKLLRQERDAMSQIARRLRVHRSLVSRVARGEKTSERVRLSIIRYLVTRAEALGTAAFLLEHGEK